MTITGRSQQLNFPKIQMWLTLCGVGLRAVLACVEFCREQFCLCRPILAFKGNVKQKQIHRCAIQTKAHIFYKMFKALALKKSTLRTVSLRSAQSRIFQSHFSLFIRGPAWVLFVKKMEVENLVTLPL